MLAAAGSKAPKTTAGSSKDHVEAPWPPPASTEAVPEMILPSNNSNGSARSVSTTTRKQLTRLVQSHFEREVAPQLKKLQSELEERAAESLQSIKDDVDTRLGAQADSVLGIVHRESATRVASLLDDAKAQMTAELLATLQAETPAMVRMSLATGPPPKEADRNTEDIRLLTHAL